MNCFLNAIVLGKLVMKIGSYIFVRSHFFKLLLSYMKKKGDILGFYYHNVCILCYRHTPIRGKVLENFQSLLEITWTPFHKNKRKTHFTTKLKSLQM